MQRWVKSSRNLRRVRSVRVDQEHGEAEKRAPLAPMGPQSVLPDLSGSDILRDVDEKSGPLSMRACVTVRRRGQL